MNKVTVSVGISFVLLVSGQALSVPLATWTGTGTTFNGGGETVGYAFLTGSQGGLATALGAFDLGGDGLGQIDLGLWDATGTNLLASTTVSSFTNPTLDPVGSGTDGFRYGAIAPVLLAANTTYVVGAFGYDLATFDVSGFSMTPGFTFLGTRYVVNGFGLAFPNQNFPAATANGVFGPNVIVQAVPGAPEVDPLKFQLPFAFICLSLALTSRQKDSSSRAGLSAVKQR